MRLRALVALASTLATLAGPCQAAALCSPAPSGHRCCCEDQATCQCHLGEARRPAPATDLAVAPAPTDVRSANADLAAATPSPAAGSGSAVWPADGVTALAHHPPPLLLTLAFRC